jgi:hypothetical protein
VRLLKKNTSSGPHKSRSKRERETYVSRVCVYLISRSIVAHVVTGEGAKKLFDIRLGCCCFYNIITTRSETGFCNAMSLSLSRTLFQCANIFIDAYPVTNSPRQLGHFRDQGALRQNLFTPASPMVVGRCSQRERYSPPHFVCASPPLPNFSAAEREREKDDSLKCS